MDTEKIVSTIKQLEDDWAARNADAEVDEKLLQVDQAPQNPDDKKFEHYRSNRARTTFDVSLALLSMELPEITLPIEDESKTEKDRMNKVERLCYGILRELETANIAAGRGGFLREAVYWALRWGIVAFPRIETEGRTQPEFICDLYDPFEHYPEWDRRGLSKLARVYFTTQDAIDGMMEERKGQEGWEIPDIDRQGQKEMRVSSLWWMEGGKPWYTVLIQDKMWKTAKAYPEWTGIPVKVMPANGSPRRARPNDKDWRAFVGQCILAPNRKMFPVIDRYSSFEMQMAYNAAFPMRVTYTSDGTPPTEQPIGPGEEANLRIGQKIELLTASAGPMQAMANTIGELSEDIQKGGLNDIAFGTTRFPLAGIAIAQLKPLQHRLGPYQNVIQEFFRGMFMGFVGDLDKTEFTSISLVAREHGPRKGYMPTDFKKEDIPQVKYIEVRLPLGMQVEKLQNVQMAGMLWGRLSDETIMTDYLGIEDVGQEQDRRGADKAQDVMDSLKTIDLLEDEAERAAAKGLRRYAERLRRTAARIEEGMGEGGPGAEGELGTPSMPNAAFGGTAAMPGQMAGRMPQQNGGEMNG